MNKNKLKKMMAGSLVMLVCMGIGSGMVASKPAPSKYPPKEQEMKMEVTTEERANPAVYWYQRDDGSFDADLTGATLGMKDATELEDRYVINTPMAGTPEQPFPKVVPFSYKIDLIKYVPNHKQVEHKGKTIPFVQLANKRLKKVVYFIDKEKPKTYEPVDTPIIVENGQKAKDGEKLTASTKVKLTTKTGMGYKNENYDSFSKRPNGCPKVSMFYPTPLDVTWAGDVIEKKVIDVTPDSRLKIGETKQLKAMVVTVTYDKNKDYNDVTSTAETRWVSENPAIATVDANGVVKAKKTGKVKVRAIWKKGNYHISDTVTIVVFHSDSDDRKLMHIRESDRDYDFPPDRYNYELDFEVISIDGKTVEKNTQTTTKVRVRRQSFADKRNQAKKAIQKDIDTRKERIRSLEPELSDLDYRVDREYEREYPDYNHISYLLDQRSEIGDQIYRLSQKIAHFEREMRKLLSDETKNRLLTTQLVIRLDGAEQSTAQMVTLGENETKTYTFNWNLPNSGTVEGVVNPDQNDLNGFEEQTFDNNRRSTPIHIASHKTVTAADKATAYVEGIVRTINDEKNEQQVYKEKVTTSLQIPDYHLTRRAGFGWDYTIISKYENEDPESTTVGSVDTRSYFKNQVDNLSYHNQTWQSPEGNLNLSGLEVMLENVKTNGDRANQTKEWKLPVYYVEEYSGDMFTNPKDSGRNYADKLLNGGRKWYTHFDEPDGIYTFNSLVRDAGINKLNTNVTGNIKIDGVILGSGRGNDDYVKRSVTPNDPFPAGVGWNWQGKVHLLTRLQKWYNDWVADPKDRPLNQYVKTYFVTPKDLAKIREYNKSMNDDYIMGKSVHDVLPIKRTRDS